jgi:hypothetical protein
VRRGDEFGLLQNILTPIVTACVLAAAGVPGLAAAQAAKPAARAEEPIGRLFFTPAQRAQLDTARAQRARTTLATDETADAPATPVAQTLTYGGMVRRSDGKSTVWINNRPLHDNEPVAGTIVGRVRPDGAVTLELPQAGRSVQLKPGQSVEIVSGTVEEGFARRPAQPEAKPEADAKPKPAAALGAPERAANERELEEQKRKLAEALRTLQEAAAKGTPLPGTPPQASPR